MILPRTSIRPRIQNRRTSKYNEKAHDVDAWPVARTGRSFGFLRGRCPGADQEEEEGQEDRHHNQSGCPLIGFSNDFSTPRSPVVRACAALLFFVLSQRPRWRLGGTTDAPAPRPDAWAA